MPAKPSTRRPDPAVDAEADDLPADDATALDDGPEDLSDTGLDLSEAGDLDADNVLADEESARIVQAPD